MAWTNAQNKIISNQIYLGVQEKAQTPFFANTKWSAESQDAQQVTIVGVGAVSIDTYTPGSDITPTVGSPTASVLAVDQFKQFYVTQDYTQKLVGDILTKLADKSTMALVLESDKYILNTLMTKVLFPTNWYAGVSDVAVDVNGANILSVLEDLGENLDENNVPMDQRSLVLPPSLITKVRIAMRKSGLSVEPVTNVLLNRAGSFRCEGFNILPSNQYTNSTGYKVFYGHADAIASAYLEPVVESGKVEKQFADYTKGLFRFGAKVLDETVGGVAYLKPVAEA